MCVEWVNATVEILAFGAGITVGWVFRCEIAGPRVCTCFPFAGSASVASEMVISVVTPSPGDRKGQRTILFFTALPALDKSVVISSMGRKYIALVYISSINNKVGRLLHVY